MEEVIIVAKRGEICLTTIAAEIEGTTDKPIVYVCRHKRSDGKVRRILH